MNIFLESQEVFEASVRRPVASGIDELAIQ